MRVDHTRSRIPTVTGVLGSPILLAGVLVFGWSMAVSITAQAQDPDRCENVLARADRIFKGGEFENAASLLNECVEAIEDLEQKLRAYGLLAQIYHRDRESVLATGALLSLINLAPPDYIPDPEVEELMNTYNISPPVPKAAPVEARGPLVGHVKSPAISPSNPDLIMYERTPLDTLDIQELYLYNTATNTGRSLGQSEGGGGRIFERFDPMNPGAQAFSLYEGEIVWRPCLDADERQWFAYVGSSITTDGLDLFLSFVDSQGRLSSATPIHIPHEGAVQTPRWSPDCQSLIFVSGSQAITQIYWIEEVSEILKKRRGDTVRPLPITNALTFKLHPDWSPDGRYIAYQTEQETGGLINWQIHAIRLDEYRPGRLPRPIPMTPELDEFHEYQPSWSPDGVHLAFYVSQSKVGDETVTLLQDIGVVAVYQGDGDGPISTGPLPGLIPRLAINVLPNRGRGPVWNPFEETREIIYVKHDEANNDPIYTANLDLWVGLKKEYEREFSSRFETVNHRDLSVVAMPTGLRVVFISQEGLVNKVRVKDVSLPEINYTIWTRVELAKSKALKRSLLAPGLGQMYKGQKTKGVLFLVAEVAAMGAAVFFASQGKSGKLDVLQADYLASLATDPVCLANRSSACSTEAFRVWQEEYDTVKGNQQLAIGAVGLAVSIWVFNVIDSATGFPRMVRKPISLAGANLRVRSAQVHLSDLGGALHHGLRLQVTF